MWGTWIFIFLIVAISAGQGFWFFPAAFCVVMWLLPDSNECKCNKCNEKESD